MNSKFLFLKNQYYISIVSYLIIIVVIFIFIMFGIWKWPGLHHDSVLFVPPILNLALGKGWIFESYTFLLVNRDSNEYFFHGVLFPIFFGLLLKVNTYEKLLLCCSLINTLTIVVYTFLFNRRLDIKSPNWRIFIATMFGIMSGVICLTLQGRPEHLAPIIISFPLLTQEFTFTRKHTRYVSYITLGLLFILSPLVGIIYGMGILFWLVVYYPQRLRREFLLTSIFSIVTCILIIEIFCPFSSLHWVINTFFAGHSEIMPTDWWRLKTTGFSLTNPGWNWLIITITLLILRTFCLRKQFIFFVLWSMLGIYLLPKVQIYGYIGFFPLLLLMIVDQKYDWMFLNKTGKKLIKYFSIIFASLYSAVLIRFILLFILYWQYGASFAETKTKLRQVINQINQKSDSVAFYWLSNPSFIIFGKPGESYITAESSIISSNESVDNLFNRYESKFDKRIVYIVLPQLGHISTPPPTLNQGMFDLVYNGWTEKRASFMGIKLGGAIPGYQFALYKLNEYE